MPFLNYLNYFATVVGYLAIGFILLIIFFFIGLLAKEKYSGWKWKKEQVKKQKEAEKQPSASSSQSNPTQPAEQQKEAPKESAQQEANVQLSIKQ